MLRRQARDNLKDNIRGAIGEIQLHTIDNVLKNSTDCVGYCITIAMYKPYGRNNNNGDRYRAMLKEFFFHKN